MAEPKRRRDTRQCRICLGGADEIEELGPLIKPCKCKGSIRVSSAIILRLLLTFVNSDSMCMFSALTHGEILELRPIRISGVVLSVDTSIILRELEFSVFQIRHVSIHMTRYT